MAERPIKLKSAWLVTWTGTGDSVPEDEIVAIFNHRFGTRAIRDMVQQLYVAIHFSSPADKASFARNPKAFPCPVEMSPFGHIMCGMNPFLYARLVTNLTVIGEQTTWTEPPSVDERRQRLREAGILRD